MTHWRQLPPNLGMPAISCDDVTEGEGCEGWSVAKDEQSLLLVNEELLESDVCCDDDDVEQEGGKSMSSPAHVPSSTVSCILPI